MEIHISVEGRVQGVGFRAWTRTVATELGIRGWVGNRADGSVEIHAAGPKDVVEELMRRLRSGPRGASVRRVNVGGRAQQLPAAGFEIRL
jgi:acylphosphatase